MSSVEAMTGSERTRGSAVLTVGFGTAVAMWAIGYFGRLPSILLPSPALLVLFLTCLLVGGYVAGRFAGRGIAKAALAGVVTGLLNLLILGSLLTGEQSTTIAPSALWWIPGSILVSVLLAMAGAAVGSTGSAVTASRIDWTAMFARVAVGATLLLLAVGGLVTSKEAGLAVVDWPNSFGYNMFLYPLSRMTGGIYYEHAHRLFGALVGLTTVVLAVLLQRSDDRPWLRVLGWMAVLMVIVQGILGGLRVTGNFTLSASPEDMAPSLALAVLHGVLGQVFFATLVSIAVFTTDAWRAPWTGAHESIGLDRRLGTLLVPLLLLQLVLGALQRHMADMLVVHITMACIVAPLALAVGVRFWGLNPGRPRFRRLGLTLVVVTGVQLLLGIGAFAATGVRVASAPPPAWEVVIATAHQWCGAILLGTTVVVTLWTWRGGRSRWPSM